MRYRLRLNGTQDADLIALYRAGYPLGQAFADAARIILGGARDVLPDVPNFPDGAELDLSELRVSITIPDGVPGGKEAIAALGRAEKGFRALIFRSCLRNALPVPYISGFTGSGVQVIRKQKDTEASVSSEDKAGISGENITDYHNDVPAYIPTTSSSVPDSTITDYHNDAPAWIPATSSSVPDSTATPYRNETGTAEMELPGTPYEAAVPEPAHQEDGVQETINTHKRLFGGFVEEY